MAGDIRIDTAVDQEISASRSLARFAAGLGTARPPEAVLGRAKALMIDTLAAAFGGRAVVMSIPVMLDALRQLGFDKGTAAVIGEEHSWSAPGAAFAHGIMAHAMDMDDPYLPSPIHPSAVIVPTVLACGALTAVTGDRALIALVAGYEVMCRIALATQSSDHIARGFHQTATIGAFGAAVTASVALGLDEAGIANALGLAGSQAAGSTQFAANGAWNKVVHVGHAAMNGVIAAVMARTGVLGASAPLEGPRGFLNAYSNGATPAPLTAGLGERWETMRIGVKPYPCCRCSHPAIDALIALSAGQAIEPENIRSIRIGISRYALSIVALGPAKWQPASTIDGQFSLPFVAAATVLEGDMRWSAYDLIGSERVDRLLQKIAVEVDPQAEANHPDRWSARVVLETSAGRFERWVETPLGEPETFPSEQDALARLVGYAEPVIGRAQALDLREWLGSIEKQSIGAFLTPPGNQTVS